MAWLSWRFCALTFLAVVGAVTIELVDPYAALASTAQPRNVLALYSYDTGLSAPTAGGIARATSRSPVPVQIFDEFLDLMRFPGPQREQLLSQVLRQKYAGLRFDVVLCAGSPALDFWLHEGNKLAPDAPVLLIFVDQQRLKAMHLPASYVSAGFSFDDPALLDWMLQLQPGLENIFVLAGATPYESYWASQRASVMRRHRPALHYSVLRMDTLANLQSKVSALPSKSALVLYSLSRDSAGRFFMPAEAIGILARSANAPIYSNFSYLIGQGAIGGRMVDYGLGEWAAALLLRLLNGESPEHIGQAALKNRFVLDFRALERWHIDVSRVPAGTVIVNRQYSFWELYAGRIISAALAMVFESALIFLLLFELRRRKRVEQMMKQMSGKLLNAQEEERSRIARELHDDLGQQLAMLGFGLTALQRHIGISPEKAFQKVATLEEQLGHLAGSLRQISHELHPAMLDFAGLPTALRSHAADLGAATGIQIAVEADDQASNLPEPVALCLFRICQEALRNATKHSHATQVKVILRCVEDGAELLVRDNGRGFRASTRRGLGLQSMQERADLLGGTVLIRSHPGQGATVKVSLPVPGRDVLKSSSSPNSDPPNRHDDGFIRT